MQLGARDLLKALEEALIRKRQKLSVQPGLALIWVGEDEQVGIFVRAKQAKAKRLDCQFFLHHFPTSSPEQIIALIKGLNKKKDVHGIVLQLPLPSNWPTERLIEIINHEKDVDSLKNETILPAPTPSGIVELMLYHKIDPSKLSTVILGAGKLVGEPLAEIFTKKGWRFQQFDRDAAKQVLKIKQADILITATGVKNLVTPEMVNKKMIVIDGAGVDIDVAKIEPLVKAITPTRGAIGPLTVHFLFANLLQATDKLSHR